MRIRSAMTRRSATLCMRWPCFLQRRRFGGFGFRVSGFGFGVHSDWGLRRPFEIRSRAFTCYVEESKASMDIQNPAEPRPGLFRPHIYIYIYISNYCYNNIYIYIFISIYIYIYSPKP